MKGKQFPGGLSATGAGVFDSVCSRSGWILRIELKQDFVILDIDYR